MASTTITQTTMLDNFSHSCIAIEVLVGVRAGTTVSIVVGVEMVVIRVRTNVVVDSLIDVVTDDLVDVFIGVYADMLVEAGVSEVEIIVVTAPVIVLEFVVPVS